MKYRTKQQRLMAITEKYRKRCSVKVFTTTEVAKWAISMGLWPVPKRGDPKEICVEWEAHLETIGKYKLPPADGEPSD